MDKLITGPCRVLGLDGGAGEVLLLLDRQR